MKRSIKFNRLSRLGMVSALAMVMAAGMGCSVQSASPVEHASLESNDQFISTALVGGVAFSTTGVLTVTVTDETVEIYINAADSALVVNGVHASDSNGRVAIAAGKSANVTKVAVVDASASAGSVVILNYINGVFGLGTKSTTTGSMPVTTYTAGTTLTFAAGAANTLVVKGTSTVDNFAAGANGISLTNAKAPTLDITTAGAVGVTAFKFFMGDGDDLFSAGGNAATGSGVFPHAVAVYGGNGNDTLVEGTVSTPNETFSGGAGTDTVDYSLRTAAVSVAIDPLGLITSGATPTTAGDPTAGATEADIILDADVIKGGTGNDQMMGGIAGKVTLNGGLGNDTFCEGLDAYANGTDTLVGGGGSDTVDYSLRTHSLTVTMDGKTASGDPTANTAHGEADVIGADIANIKLGSGGGTYNGNALDNTFYANSGTTLSTVNGLAGNDTLVEGADTMNTGKETFAGGAGIDTMDYSLRTNALTIVMDGTTLSGDTGEGDKVNTDVENLFGGTNADHLTGNALDNDIEGNNGGDVIIGLAGNDTLVGNKTQAGSDTADIHGNDLADTAEPGAFNLCLNAGASNAQMATTANCQVLVL